MREGVQMHQSLDGWQCGSGEHGRQSRSAGTVIGPSGGGVCVEVAAFNEDQERAG